MFRKGLRPKKLQGSPCRKHYFLDTRIAANRPIASTPPKKMRPIARDDIMNSFLKNENRVIQKRHLIFCKLRVLKTSLTEVNEVPKNLHESHYE